MRPRTLPRSIWLLVIGAFLLVTTVQLIPASVSDSGCGMEMASMQGAGSAAGPCTDTTPSCIIDLGCAALTSLPPPESPLPVPCFRARVAYAIAAAPLRGLSIKPDLTPPILIA